MRRLSQLIFGESGAVTVDFVVLAAAGAVLALVVITPLVEAALDVTGSVETVLAETEVAGLSPPP